MSETLNNIISFDYSVDPTTLMGNSWITNNTDTTQNTVTGVGEQTITHYWRTITFDFSGKSAYAGVFRIEVDENGTPVQPYNFENISGDAVTVVTYSNQTLEFGNGDAVGILTSFKEAKENTTYTEKEVAGTWSYVASTTTETDYDYYEVELYVNSDVTNFPNNLFYSDQNITSVEFDTYSITSIEDGVDKVSGAFCDCGNLASITLPDNLEYLGACAIYDTAITSITLPSTVEEIGSVGLNITNLSLTSLATVPPTIHTDSISDSTALTIHETALQSYINSDWSNYVTSISTIETPTYNNVLKFDYAVDPTSKLDNLWVNSCTDTTQNTVSGVDPTTTTHYWRTIEYEVGGKGDTYTGSVKVEVNENGVPVSPYNYETLTGETVENFSYNANDDYLEISISHAGMRLTYFSVAIENTTYETDPIYNSGTWSYDASTTTETVYDHYEVTLHLNSVISSFETLMFAEDTDILSVEFPASITYIGDDAFNGCTSLASVTMNQPTPPTLGDDVFKLVSATLFVPEGGIQIYRQELGGTFPTIKPIKLPGVSFGFNLSRMGNVDYVRQGVVRRY